MAVSVVRRGHAPAATVSGVRSAARRLLRLLNERNSELTISLVDDAEMQRLNHTYRGKDRPTDVLAFAMREGRRVAADQPVLGDVVISLDTAARQARRRRVPLAQEVETLLVHGVLHVLGYDHERSVPEARRMRAMERRLCAALRAEHGLPSGARP